MAFKCVIVTPEQQMMDESATQATLPAWDGQLGILTGRAPLLVKLGLGPLRVDLPGGRSRTFFVDGGIAQMKDNHLTVLTSEATPAEDIDAQAAKAEFTKAEERPANDPKARQARTHEIERARMKQQIAERR